MGMLNGVRQLNRILSGEDDAAALETNLATASNLASFAQVLGNKSQLTLAVNNATAAGAITGSALASDLLADAEYLNDIVLPLGSISRPNVITTLFRAGRGSFNPGATFASWSPNLPALAVGNAWLTLADIEAFGRYHVSYDGGNSWTILPVIGNPNSNSVKNCAIGNVMFAVGPNGDGTTNQLIFRWVEGQSTAPTTVLNTAGTGQLSGVAYGNSVYVCMRTGSTNAWSSANGISWTARTGISINNPTICWCDGAGLFTAVGGSGTTGATSPDGVTWTSRAGQPNLSLSPEIVASPALFVLANTASMSTVFTSPDGFTWTSRSLPSTKTRGQLYYEQGIFFFTPSGTTNTFTWSADGITWRDSLFEKMPTLTSVSRYSYSPARGEILGLVASASTLVYLA